MGPELGPDVGDRSVVLEDAAVDQDVRDRRGRGLAGGGAVEESVRSDWAAGRGGGDAGNRVDDLLAVLEHGHLEADLRPGVDQFVDALLDLVLEVRHGVRPVCEFGPYTTRSERDRAS